MPPTAGEQLAELRTDVRWIRETLEQANLVDRVTRLELQIGQVKAVVASIPILLTVVAAAAKYAGLLH